MTVAPAAPPPMQLRWLTPADAAAFQSLRLAGLRESPAAFASSHDEEASRPLAAVAQSLASDAGRTVFGAFVDGALVGLVGVGREPGPGEGHRGFVRSMVVAPGARRRGIGTALMDEALRHARSMPGLEQLVLSVTADNLAAITIYRRFGFTACGTAPAALRLEGSFYDEVQMVCHFAPD